MHSLAAALSPSTCIYCAEPRRAGIPPLSLPSSASPLATSREREYSKVSKSTNDDDHDGDGGAARDGGRRGCNETCYAAGGDAFRGSFWDFHLGGEGGTGQDDGRRCDSSRDNSLGNDGGRIDGSWPTCAIGSIQILDGDTHEARRDGGGGCDGDAGTGTRDS